MSNKRVVITGIGIISPIGIGKDAYWQVLQEGRSRIKPITLLDTKSNIIKTAGKITELDAKEILGIYFEKKGQLPFHRCLAYW